MYRLVKNKGFRNFIIVFSLITCFSFNFRVKKTEAFVSEAIAIGGGISIAPEIALALVGGAVVYGGYKLYDNYSDTFKRYVIDKMSEKGLSSFFNFVKDKSGNKYASITPSGIDFVQDVAKSLKTERITTTVPLPSNNTDTNGSSFTRYGYVGHRMPYLAKGKKEYIYIGRVSAGDTLSFLSIDADKVFNGWKGEGHYTKEYTYTYDRYYRIMIQGIAPYGNLYTCSYLQVSNNGSKWELVTEGDAWTFDTSFACVGYKISSGTVSIGASECFVSSTKIDGLASAQVKEGSTVAIPLTTSFDGVNGDKVYSSDNLIVSEYTGLSSDTITVPSEGSSTESTESTGVISGVINAVGDKVTSAVSAVEGAIGSVGSAIKSVLSSIANTVTKIYDWACDLVGDIVNAFSGWLDTIISLLNQIVTVISDIVVNIVNALIDGLLSLLQSVFVPAADFFMNNFNEIKGMIFDKIGYDQYVNIFGDGSSKELKDITINWYGKTIVICKLTTFNYFRNLFNDLVYGFTFFGLAIYNYNQIYRIFRNNNYAKMEQTIERMKK